MDQRKLPLQHLSGRYLHGCAKARRHRLEVSERLAAGFEDVPQDEGMAEIEAAVKATRRAKR